MTRWPEFIAQQRLHAVQSATPDLGGAGIICPLDYFGVLKVSGEDAETFLHNQASNDLRTLGRHEARPAVLCNPKGRMYCSFSAFSGGDGVWYLQMPRERVAPVMKRLSMYRLRAKVELTDVSDALPAFGVIGAAADERPEQAVAAVSAAGRQPRTVVVADGAVLIELWQAAVQKGCRPMTCDVWRCCDIQSGIAYVSNATSEELVPQMANMDLLGAVSFTKGCYPGQEIVARTHYLGKLKRRMYPFSSEARDIAAGDPVFSDRQSEPCGQVVDFCPVAEGRSPGLAVLRIAAAGDALHIGAPDGAALVMEPPPYAISEQSHNPEAQT